MTEPWFTVEVYSVMPGLVVGSAGGLYGVLLGLLINSKNIRQYFIIMTIVTLLICLGVIAFGVIATVFDQPGTILYDFVSTGLLGMFVVIGVWYFVKQNMLNKPENENNGSS
jgi:hypothetical protein